MSQYCAVELIDTLMRFKDDAYLQSGDRYSYYCFRVPDAWHGDILQEKVFAVAEKMYVEFNTTFRANEPNDPNYLKVLKTQAFPLTPEQVATQVWRNAPVPSAWEWTPCVSVNADGTYQRVAPSEF